MNYISTTLAFISFYIYCSCHINLSTRYILMDTQISLIEKILLLFCRLVIIYFQKNLIYNTSYNHRIGWLERHAVIIYCTFPLQSELLFINNFRGIYKWRGSFPNRSSWGTIYTCSLSQSSFIEVFINEVLTWQFLQKQTHLVL